LALAQAVTKSHCVSNLSTTQKCQPRYLRSAFCVILDSSYRCSERNAPWQGHELLDKLNSQSLWNTVMAYARGRSVELPFQAISILARKGREELL
jgi:hypothetical protein